MKSLKQFGKELMAILQNRKVLVPIIAVLLIPVLYSAMFLGAFWDPYGRLNDLPVAVVNTDRGAQFNGKSLHIGDEFEEQLKNNPKFNWEFVSIAEAEEGLRNNAYYMAIEIPADFSEKTTTLTSEHPSAAQIKFVPNESFNFLAAQIGNSAVEQMKAALNKEVTEAYARTVFDQMQLLADGIEQASDGAGQLADGAAKAKAGMQLIELNLNKLASGSIALKEGALELNAGAGTLERGTSDASAGASALADGLDKLASAQQRLGSSMGSLSGAVDSLRTGTDSLSGGFMELAHAGGKLATGATDAANASRQLADGAAAAEAGNAKLQDGAAQLVQGMERLAQSNAQLAQDPSFQTLLAASRNLETGLTNANAAQRQLHTGAVQLNAGLQALNSGATVLETKLQETSSGARLLASGSVQAAEGAKQLEAAMTAFGRKLEEAKTGSQSLASGTKQLAVGAVQLSEGMARFALNLTPFADGSAQLESGAKQIASGLVQLDDGTHELSGKLREAADKTSELNASDSMYDMFASPVQLDVEKVNEVPNYGTGFAPYFLSLGLYVGALLITIVYSVREPAAFPVNGRSWFWSKALTLSLVGVLQALIADAALLLLLDLQVKNVQLFVLYSILTSITFMMLIQFLVTALHNPGRFIAIVLLIFQLTSSAGTFPLELIPNWLQKVTPWLPMTYSVAGLKDVISSGDFSAMWTHASFLAMFTLLFAGLSRLFFAGAHRKAKSGPLAAQ